MRRLYGHILPSQFLPVHHYIWHRPNRVGRIVSQSGVPPQQPGMLLLSSTGIIIIIIIIICYRFVNNFWRLIRMQFHPHLGTRFNHPTPNSTAWSNYKEEPLINSNEDGLIRLWRITMGPGSSSQGRPRPRSRWRRSMQPDIITVTGLSPAIILVSNLGIR